MINGLILSTPVAAAVWLVLRLTPRWALNATTRYAVWWATLALILYLSIPHFQTSAPPAIASHEIPRIVVPLKTSPAQVIRWILESWLVLSVLLLLRLMVSYRVLHGRRERALDASADLRARSKDSLDLRLGTRIGISEEVSKPVAVGPWRPTILIPARFLIELDAEELDQIVLHEAAHLARRDDLALLIQRLIEALLPLHPVVRWIMRQIDLEREIACDDFVVATLQSPWAYARCLTRVVELSGNVRGSLAAAMAVNGLSHLEQRVSLLLDGARRTHTRLRKTRLGAIVAVLALFGWFGGRIPGVLSFAMAQAAQVATPAPTTPPTVQVSQAPQPQPAKPAAAPLAPARPLDPSEDPEGKVLSYRFGWELSYLRSVKNIDLDEDPDVKGFTEVFKQLLENYKSFNGTAAQQDAAIKAQLTRFRALVDQLTEARLKEETRQ